MIKHRQDGSLVGVKTRWRLEPRLTAYSVILITALFRHYVANVLRIAASLSSGSISTIRI